MRYYDFEEYTRLPGSIALNKNTLKTIYYTIIIMLYLSMTNSFSWAQGSKTHVGSPKIYTIYNISIDETASNSKQASRAAVRAAQRVALDKLFRKIIRQEDHASLPKLNDGQITELVSGLEVANEKSSRVRYMADFTVHFSRDKIYNFLSEQQIPFAETLSTPASILAVVEKNGAVILWEKNNGWRKMWDEYDTANNLVPIQVIETTLANRMAITAWQTQQGDMELLQKFADTQKIRGLYVMNARIDNDLTRERNTLELVIFKVGEDKHEFRTTIIVENSEDEFAELYNEAIKQATYWLDNQWKEKVMIHFGTSSHLKVNIKYGRSEDWFKIKRKLESISLIRKVIIKNFTIMAANVEIEHSGDVAQIILTLEQDDLILTDQAENMAPEIDKNWVLTLKK